ncbi:4'-phosphopantetheinyl transferase family protein [Streptomyces hypolithicus]
MTAILYASGVLPAPTATAALGEPILVSLSGPWDTVRRALRERGSAVLIARLADWLPAEHEVPSYAALLGRDWARYQEMGNEAVRSRFLASRLLLKHAAGAVLEAEPAGIDLAYKPSGRPYLRGCDQVDISLSHTGEMLVAGLTRRGCIGVDTELDSRQLLGTAVVRQICTPYETALLEEMAQEWRNAAMIRLWTLKEAYSKAIGQGLRFRFTEFGFAPGARRMQVLRPDGTPGSGDEWSFGTWQVAPGYTVSVALFDMGLGDASDIAARTMLDEGMVDALLRTARQECPAAGDALS